MAATQEIRESVMAAIRLIQAGARAELQRESWDWRAQSDGMPEALGIVAQGTIAECLGAANEYLAEHGTGGDALIILSGGWRLEVETATEALELVGGDPLRAWEEIVIG